MQKSPSMMAARRHQNGWTLNEVRLFDHVARLLSGAYHSKDKFQTLCNVTADISGAQSTRKVGTTGKVCYDLHYEVVLLVGLTELKAQIRWVDSITVRIYERSYSNGVF